MTSSRNLSKNITLQKASREHIPQILAISDEQLGDKYLSFASLEDAVNQTDRAAAKVGISPGGELAGFYLSYVYSGEELEAKLEIPLSKVSGQLKNLQRIGVLKTVAVKENCQGLGVGSELVRDGVNELKKRRVQAICSVAWKSGEKTNIGGVLSKFNLKPVLKIPEYWKNHRPDQAFICPACGQPCLCPAVVYALVL